MNERVPACPRFAFVVGKWIDADVLENDLRATTLDDAEEGVVRGP